MIKTTYTPGPWTTSIHFSGAEVYGGNVCVADVYGKDKKANAKLIAAAPEMLRALEASLTRLSRTIDADVISMINGAIAKANGEIV